MQLFEESKNFSFYCFVLLCPLEGCVQQLNPKWIQSQLRLEEPPNLTGGQLHTFRSKICQGRSKTGAELRNPLTWSPFHLQVKGIPELATLVKRCPSIDALQRLQQLVDAAQCIFLDPGSPHFLSQDPHLSPLSGTPTLLAGIPRHVGVQRQIGEGATSQPDCTFWCFSTSSALSHQRISRWKALHDCGDPSHVGTFPQAPPLPSLSLSAISPSTRVSLKELKHVVKLQKG